MPLSLALRITISPKPLAVLERIASLAEAGQLSEEALETVKAVLKSDQVLILEPDLGPTGAEVGSAGTGELDLGDSATGAVRDDEDSIQPI